MPTKVLRDPGHVDALAVLLRGRKMPLTVSWVQGASRSSAQNRLAQRWFTDIATQLGDQTHEDVRAECKLTIGVPILRTENEAFRVSYDRTMKGLPYEEKLEAIKAFDLPVTRLMTVKQMTAFMDEMQRKWTRQGIRLTDPEALKYEQEFL
ncbi:hypothetical protein [Actibacterium sp. MT2.3-13A]|uniref:hypothetical protein n=1 Tax=Actibacterium sp. MT2.3-13A TaxID=2828332 RepID=UPI001BA735FD|nr:hypothetical protein [Actibacterium sp. MT2.3-13A]